MTFIVLDVEIIFLYPFTTVFRSFVPGAYGLVVMGVFLLVLLVPFAYLLSTGALDWGPLRKLRTRPTPDVMRASGKPGAGGLDPKTIEPETEAA
jgi:NADH-quinone oxidoreductase subunit A